MTMILLLTKYPDVQAKLQDELDRVVGSGRLPDFGDFSSLPYFQCVLDETLRSGTDCAMVLIIDPVFGYQVFFNPARRGSSSKHRGRCI